MCSGMTRLIQGPDNENLACVFYSPPKSNTMLGKTLDSESTRILPSVTSSLPQKMSLHTNNESDVRQSGLRLRRLQVRDLVGSSRNERSSRGDFVKPRIRTSLFDLEGVLSGPLQGGSWRIGCRVQ